MAIPRSFAAFQALFEDLNPTEETPLEPPGIPGDSLASTDDADVDSARRTKALSIATDAILADLHDQEGLRDAVIDSLPNLANGTVILIISPSLDATEELTDFLSEQPRIKRFALGARKLRNGDRIRAVKLEVVQTDDECDPPDEAGRLAKDQEQNNQHQPAEVTDGDTMRTGFFRGSGSPTM